MFTNNFASISGVIRVADNGYFEIYDSQIFNNYASQSPISELFNSAFVSVLDNTTIYRNEALSYDEILSELNSS